MYNTLENSKLSLPDLTSIIHHAIKMLSKVKSSDNETQLRDLPIPLGELNFEICHALLNEINIRKIQGNNVEIDKQINNLYNFLYSRMSKELNTDDKNGKSLLEKLKQS